MYWVAFPIYSLLVIYIIALSLPINVHVHNLAQLAAERQWNSRYDTYAGSFLFGGYDELKINLLWVAFLLPVAIEQRIAFSDSGFPVIE